MDLPGYIAAAAGGWIVLGCVSCTGWALFAEIYKRRSRSTVTRAQYPPPVPPVAGTEVNWLPFLPPVPRPAGEGELLADQPVDVWLTPELSDRLFNDLIAMEGLQ